MVLWECNTQKKTKKKPDKPVYRPFLIRAQSVEAIESNDHLRPEGIYHLKNVRFSRGHLLFEKDAQLLFI